MKIIIQIPCFNEEKQLKNTINAIRSALLTKDFNIPNQIIEWEILIINDGSIDNTEKVAKDLNVEHIV